MKLILLALSFISLLSLGQFSGEVFAELKTKNFFQAKVLYGHTKETYSKEEQEYIEASLENAFNQLTESNERIDLLMSTKNTLSDSISLQLYYLRTDNFIKLFEYKKAAETLEKILNKYSSSLDDDVVHDVNNSLTIWKALQEEAKQEVVIPETVRQKMNIDKAGLKNLTTSVGNEKVDFIFDTGANISTVTESTAKKLHLKIIPAGIEVGTVTGLKVKSDLGVCPLLKLGEIEIKNAVFLILSDSALYIPQIDYQINGIIGFPIINALREIQITKDGYFIVPKKETSFKDESNLALNGLEPMICMNGMHFTFDSGANESMLYSAFYLKNKAVIDAKYPAVEFAFGGAGGSKKFSGFQIKQEFQVLDKTASFDKIMVVKEKIKEEETVHGNIGQDLIQQFDKMTLNFHQMFVKFD